MNYGNLPFAFPANARPLGPRIYQLPDPVSGKQVVKRVKDFRLFDTVRCIKGTAITKGQSVTAFQVSAGNNGVTLNTNASYNKVLDLDTNLKGNGGQLPAGYFMQVLSIQFAVLMTNSLDASPFGTGFAIDPTRGADASADNTIAALNKGIGFQFTMDDTTYEEAPIGWYPSDFGVVGYAGATATGVNNLGLGRSVWLSEPHWLVEQYRFGINVNANCTISVMVNEAWIQTVLVGRMFCPVS